MHPGKGSADTLGPMSDASMFSFNKGAIDNIIASESQAFSVSKSATDSVAVTDTPVLSPRKGITDSASMTDNIVVVPLVASSQLNRGILGFVLLNAD